DKYEWGRFPETAKTLNKEGYDVLIFDFSGSFNRAFIRRNDLLEFCFEISKQSE
ncbi:unnamed protein product, partial [marine sediment metagenome]